MAWTQFIVLHTCVSYAPCNSYIYNVLLGHHIVFNYVECMHLIQLYP